MNRKIFRFEGVRMRVEDVEDEDPGRLKLVKSRRGLWLCLFGLD